MGTSYIRIQRPGGPDYSDFCSDLVSAASTWNQLAGLLVVKINGAEVTSASPGPYSGSSITVKFEMSPRLQDFMAANPDVDLTYSYEAFCDDGPAHPDPGSGGVTHNLEITIDRITACSGGASTAVEPFDVVMSTPTNRALFDATCAPYGNNSGITQRQLSFSTIIDP